MRRRCLTLLFSPRRVLMPQSMTKRSHSTTPTFDWSIDGEEARRLNSETRRKILHRQLGRRGLEILRPIGRGTFGRVVLVREIQKREQLFAVKIQQISKNELGPEQAKEAELQMKKLKSYVSSQVNNEYISGKLESTFQEIEREIEHANPTSGNLRWYGGELVRRAVAEAHIMQSLDHPFIVRLHDTFEEMDRLFMVLEFIPGGTLRELQHRRKDRRLTLEQTRFCVAEISLALAYLRSQNISHRDLKPSNILIDKDGHVRLVDFGLATKESDRSVFCGTAEYLAPETLLGKNWSHEPLDWWALGVMTYELLTGTHPFKGRDSQEVFVSIMMNDRLKFPDWMDNDARDFVSNLLEVDPEKRMMSGGKFFAHPFFQDTDWRKVLEKSERDSPLLEGDDSFVHMMRGRLLLPE